MYGRASRASAAGDKMKDKGLQTPRTAKCSRYNSEPESSIPGLTTGGLKIQM